LSEKLEWPENIRLLGLGDVEVSDQGWLLSHPQEQVGAVASCDVVSEPPGVLGLCAYRPSEDDGADTVHENQDRLSDLSRAGQTGEVTRCPTCHQRVPQGSYLILEKDTYSVAHPGGVIRFSPSQWAVFAYLHERFGRPVTSDELEKRIRSSRRDPPTRLALNVLIFFIREKLEVSDYRIRTIYRAKGDDTVYMLERELDLGAIP